MAISYPLVSLHDYGSYFAFLLSAFVYIPVLFFSVVLIIVVLYPSAAFVFLDGSRAIEGLVRVSYG